MPIYEYRCSACGVEKEYLQKVSEPLLTNCPECGKPTFEKLVSAAGFQLKGSGWYVTDFKNKNAKPAADKSTSGTSDTPVTPTPAATADKPSEPQKEAKPA
jgi:putative FmdB family regulatory protein